MRCRLEERGGAWGDKISVMKAILLLRSFALPMEKCTRAAHGLLEVQDVWEGFVAHCCVCAGRSVLDTKPAGTGALVHTAILATVSAALGTREWAIGEREDLAV